MVTNMDITENCVVCEKTLNEGETVLVRKGLDTFKNCSLRRKDGISEKLKNVDSVVLHVNCRKKYTFFRNVAAANNPSLKETTILRSTVSAFDFKRDCLFCSEVCDSEAEKKKPVSKRSKQFEVRSFSFKNQVIECAKKRNDDWGKKVLDRVQTVIDLVAVEARYHNLCCTNFYKPPSSASGKPGRPENVELAIIRVSIL